MINAQYSMLDVGRFRRYLLFDQDGVTVGVADNK